MAERESPLADLMPTDPLMKTAWIGSVAYTILCQKTLDAFRRDTGNTWEPSENPAERMIDKATGAELEFIRAFCKWHNENIWGDLEAGIEDD